MRSLASSFAAFIALAASVPSALAQLPNVPPGVIATGTQGPTNPPQPTLGTAINQTSYARLLSVNSIDDFCIFAPPTQSAIADSETIEVAWCTKQRNNARVIPDGTITGVSFLKNDYYVQLIGYGDFTQLNIPFGDYGGELDPHGAYGSGNPIGGNVTSNISGGDVPYAEWMLYIDYNQFCLRVCTNANSTYSAASMCWHELDEMGCEFVMPGNYNVNGTFESCDADVAYPPGWYPTATVDGTTQFSEFAQRYTGTLSDGSVYTVGDLATPAAPYFTPSSSNCVTTSTIANNIALASLGVTGAPANSGPVASGPTRSGATSGSKPTSAGTTGSTGTPNANSAIGVKGNFGLIALTVMAGYLFH
ncbi:hypothetical protein BDN72DRAFT_828692 [Pluteus cervinus]|uniref:Uncharacterized protein n=1 Tax=Pluteus cervinus TaxID=181527 RepID=A0ACD3A4X5_9AGAR|nr:hypothetical protein BDN72DRAFT_828692 [Pluteus cervinus]